jgi:hypothetical protein
VVLSSRQDGARTLYEANRVLWAYLPRFNARFGVPPAEPDSASRPLPPDPWSATADGTGTARE